MVDNTQMNSNSNVLGKSQPLNPLTNHYDRWRECWLVVAYKLLNADFKG